MRSLAFEERKAFNKKKDELENRAIQAKREDKSNSQIKKIKAANHNEWQAWLKENKIIVIFGKIFTERETAIEGTIFKTKAQNETN